MINIELNKKIIKSIKELKKQIIEDTYFPVYESHMRMYYKENTLQGLSVSMYLDNSIKDNLKHKSIEKLKNLMKLCEENNIEFGHSIWTGSFSGFDMHDVRNFTGDNDELLKIAKKQYDWSIDIFVEYKEDACNLEDEESYNHTLSINVISEKSNELIENIENLKEILKQENMLDNIMGEEAISLNWEE